MSTANAISPLGKLKNHVPTSFTPVTARSKEIGLPHTGDSFFQNVFVQKKDKQVLLPSDLAYEIVDLKTGIAMVQG